MRRVTLDRVLTFIKNETTPVTKIEYTFDNRPDVEFSAARVYSAMVGDREWRESTLLASKLSFESRSNPRIQMADLIAREAMKDLDRQIGPHKHPERKSKIALENSNRFRFFALRRDDLERERSEWVVLERDGFSEAACHEWLRERNMQDTWDNRTRFLEYLDKRALD